MYQSRGKNESHSYCGRYSKIYNNVSLSKNLHEIHICLIHQIFFNCANSARPQYAAAIFSLFTTFPNQELTDDKKTLKDANLLNAVVMQRLQ